MEVTPAKLQKWWGTLKWLSIRLGMLNVDKHKQLLEKRKAIQETLVDTQLKPQRKGSGSDPNNCWGPGTRGRRDPAGEPGPGADQSSGQVHHGDGQVQPGLQCALQRRAAHLAADGQVHEQHPGAAGLANEDHAGGGHQTEPGPAHRPIVLLVGGQMVDPLGAVVEEIQGLGGVLRDGLPDPHDQQGQDGLHPPPRNPRQVPEVAQRRLGEAGRASQGRG